MIASTPVTPSDKGKAPSSSAACGVHNWSVADLPDPEGYFEKVKHPTADRILE
ncbi:hypothetical protein SERLADRAFT_443284 [Serpula lacrymans var. lacrymans S7.9]|uniref:Uncharacterized protein n=1 Tax=Serpula lacrymans var. lacrymans (strain S7.9) TaxID=578457 RepID=F8PC43_SERL9|nr:uncharacterized protein SERLADRAFT_443284 [Serpula lacrymans var. lacrymans S7.9]EGO19243.1 hypothetical protein SERLADRAFT_443284 [Serpula lacrymans var. lacrymans S7.9]